MKIFPNATIEFTRKCEAISSTCNLIEGYEAAKAQFILKKNNLVVFNGEHDICNRKKVSEVAKLFMLTFGIPSTGCPVSKQMYCSTKNNTFAMTSARKMLKLFTGTQIQIQTIIAHDKVSCIRNAR